jgi:hypothetical protein
MTRIISLFQQKSHYLEKFSEANEEAIQLFAKGQFETLEAFYQRREDIIKVLQYIDQQMGLAQAEIKDPSKEDKDALKAALAGKDVFVNRIMKQDLEILTYIDQAKTEIIRELQDLRKSKSAIGKYKSGINLHRIDEEV